MPRLMSVRLTEDAVRERRKRVTRRAGWAFLKPGDYLVLVRKSMGLRKGEKVVRVALVRVLDVRQEPLGAITDEDVALEGFTEADWSQPAPGGWVHPGPTPAEWFIRYFTHHMPKCTPDTIVTRIEWEYVCDHANGTHETPHKGCILR